MTSTERPGTDLATAPDMGRGVVTGASLESRIHYADVLSHAGLVPRDYQGKPANVLYAVETGTMLGIHPIAAINGINIISGKPTVSPALMTALVRRAGHKVRVKVTGTVAGGDIVATCEVIRHDDPEFTYSASWDIARAKRAGLWGGKSGAWANYPEAMLKARAIGEVCREAAEDALCGIHYTPEELGAHVNGDGEIIEGAVVPDMPAQSPSAPTPAVPALDGDLVRAAILGARTKGILLDHLVEVGAAHRDPHGAVTWPRRRDLEGLRVADEHGQEVSAWALIGARGRSLPDVALAEETTPDVDTLLAESSDVTDAEIVDETTGVLA